MDDKMGVQQLMDAEQKARETVESARKQKAAKLKAAREEADNEINAYKKQREEQFQKEAAERLSGTGEHTKKLQAETDQFISKVKADYSKNKEAVVQMLINHVGTVRQ